jgi:predicted DNA-binding protein (UPF0251 family)
MKYTIEDNIRKNLKLQNITQKQAASLLNINEVTFNRKLTNSGWKTWELKLLYDNGLIDKELINWE